MLRLVHYNAGHAESELSLDPHKEYVIGRRTDAHVRLNDSQVSRLHCKLVCESGQWQVCDLGSSNGTFLNSRRITQASLHPGDVLLVGTTAFRVADSAGKPAPPAGASLASAPKPERVPLSCTRCGKALPENAVSDGKAVAVGGDTYCFACSLTLDKGTPGGLGDLFGLLKDFGNSAPGDKDRSEDGKTSGTDPK